MKILVTGAGGFVGGALCRVLVADGDEVVAMWQRAPQACALATLKMVAAALIVEECWQPIREPHPNKQNHDSRLRIIFLLCKTKLYIELWIIEYN